MSFDSRRRLPIVEESRPRTRGDCLPGGMNAERPCPYVSCKHHLIFDVSPKQPETLRVNAHAREVSSRVVDHWDELEIELALRVMPHTCALDVADEGGHLLEEVGHAIGITRERVRVHEEHALRVLEHSLTLRKINKESGDGEP